MKTLTDDTLKHRAECAVVYLKQRLHKHNIIPLLLPGLSDVAQAQWWAFEATEALEGEKYERVLKYSAWANNHLNRIGVD